ncbi:MAG: hypothetical protein H7301_09485 [Cryobacterium sp.]|nr:hypothetical protein [Oligoflexia bacterium]
MKTTSNSVYLRYEFSNEKGKLEGGDIFQLASSKEAGKMAAEIFKVALGDGVAVNVTIGTEVPFMGFLKNVGLDKKHIESEMVTDDSEPVANAKKKPSAKKKAVKKSASKPAKKKKK